MKKNGFIVMIDEEQSDHELLKMALREINFSFDFMHFESYDKAISQFRGWRKPADYIFIDTNFILCKEGKLLQKLQEEQSAGSFTIVVYSSFITLELIENLQKIGIEEFIEKTDSRSHLKNQLILLFLRT